MMPVISNLIAHEIREALGLPPGVISIDLRFASNEVVTASVVFASERDQIGKVVGILRRYELREREDEAEVLSVAETTERVPVEPTEPAQ